MMAGEDRIPEKLLHEAEAAVYPFRFDRHGVGKITEHVGQAFINYKDISLPVDGSIFAKREGRILDTAVPTFDPSTLFHLTALYGPIRPKDWKNLLAFAREMRQTKDGLQEELFEPFHQLADQRKHDYPIDTFLGNTRWQYHKRIPMIQGLYFLKLSLEQLEKLSQVFAVGLNILKA